MSCVKKNHDYFRGIIMKQSLVGNAKREAVEAICVCECVGVQCLGVNSKLLLLWGAHAMC